MLTIFNTQNWIDALVNSYGLIVKYYTVDSGKIVETNQPLSANSIPFFVQHMTKGNLKYSYLPFSDFVFPIIPINEFNEIIQYIKNKKMCQIELRFEFNDTVFQKKNIGYLHVLSLIPDISTIFASFKKTQVQQCVNRSIKEGLNYEICENLDAIDKYYKLHLLTRKKLGVPSQPIKFFKNIYEKIIKQGLGFVVNVKYKNEVISSGIFAGYDNVLTYKFSASNPEYLMHRPNNLMLWGGIQEGKKRNFEILDFGRTELDNEGLRKFKLGWGTTELPLYYSFYPPVEESTTFLWMKNNIVSPIIKKSPLFICRWSGELFYKYFG